MCEICVKLALTVYKSGVTWPFANRNDVRMLEPSIQAIRRRELVIVPAWLIPDHPTVPLRIEPTSIPIYSSLVPPAAPGNAYDHCSPPTVDEAIVDLQKVMFVVGSV